MKKAELRGNMIKTLKNLSDVERHNHEHEILDALMKTDLWANANTIGITISNGFEWDTEAIIKEAWKQDKEIAVPKCDPKNKLMDFYVINSFEQLEVVYFNLKEPIPKETKKINKDSIDLLVVPGLVFNKQGFRIGFGGGFYDRFLTDFNNTTLSLIHPSQLVENIPVDQHDISVNYLLTTEGFINE